MSKSRTKTNKQIEEQEKAYQRGLRDGAKIVTDAAFNLLAAGAVFLLGLDDASRARKGMETFGGIAAPGLCRFCQKPATCRRNPMDASLPIDRCEDHKNVPKAWSSTRSSVG